MEKIAQLQLYFSPSTAKMTKMRIAKNINNTQKYNTGLGLREIDSIKCGKVREKSNVEGMAINFNQ